MSENKIEFHIDNLYAKVAEQNLLARELSRQAQTLQREIHTLNQPVRAVSPYDLSASLKNL